MSRPDTPTKLPDDRRRDAAAQRLADYVKATVNSAPELTPEQRARIAGLLVPTDSGGGRAA